MTDHKCIDGGFCGLGGFCKECPYKKEAEEAKQLDKEAEAARMTVVDDGQYHPEDDDKSFT